MGILFYEITCIFCDRNDMRNPMKKISGIELFIIMAAGLVGSVNAAVTITRVGDGSGYDISGTEVANFRSTGTAKSYDVDGDNVYGTAGYMVFGGAAASSGGWVLFGDATAYSNPSFVTTFGAGANFNAIAKYESYALYDNPSEPIAASVADFGATAIALGTANSPSTSVGGWNAILTFMIDATAPSTFRVGLMGGNEGNTDGRWDPSGLRISFENGTEVDATGLEVVSGTGMVFFDISVTGGTSGTFYIDSQRRSTSGGSSISGITFDVKNVRSLSLIAITSH
jgi:hypothetical protein